MQSFDEILKQAAADTNDHIGLSVFVNGLSYSATIFDGEVERDSGIRNEIILDFKKEDAAIFRKGDQVVLNNNAYTIARIGNDNQIDPFRAVELLRA